MLAVSQWSLQNLMLLRYTVVLTEVLCKIPSILWYFIFGGTQYTVVLHFWRYPVLPRLGIQFLTASRLNHLVMLCMLGKKQQWKISQMTFWNRFFFPQENWAKFRRVRFALGPCSFWHFVIGTGAELSNCATDSRPGFDISCHIETMRVVKVHFSQTEYVTNEYISIFR